MKKFLLLSFLASLSCGVAAQVPASDGPVEAFRIAQSLLSGLDIPRLKLENHPERAYFQKRIYKGSELSVFILSSETALNEIKNFPIDEFVYYLNGKAEIVPQEGDALSFYAGDYLFVPKGFSGNWTNNGGNTYHLELSVISNRRANSTMISEAKMPFVLDRALMSGIGLTAIDTATYRDVLYEGVELDVVTESEKSNKREILNSEKEVFIHVLNGSLTLRAKNGEANTFYSGDFFVLPKGFTGRWESKGQNLLRILKVIPK
ncbi:MAG: cupin domain-containing protein [Bacteroidota bacterium]